MTMYEIRQYAPGSYEITTDDEGHEIRREDQIIDDTPIYASPDLDEVVSYMEEYNAEAEGTHVAIYDRTGGLFTRVSAEEY